MQYLEWRRQLETEKVLSPVYLFYGLRDDLKREAIEFLQVKVGVAGNAWNYETLSAAETNPVELWPKLSTPAWGEGSRLIVITDLHKNPELEQAAVDYWQQEMHPNYLVCLGNGKGALYRALEPAGAAIEFSPSSRNNEAVWLQERARAAGFTLEPAAAAYLATLPDAGQELDKACLYVYPSRSITLAAVQEITAATPEASIFQLVDAVGERQLGAAIRHLRQLLSGGEPPVRVAFMIARQFRLIGRARQYPRAHRNELAKELGVPPFVAARLQKQSRCYTWKELQQVQVSLLELDRQLKTGGDATLSLELFIVSLAQIK